VADPLSSSRPRFVVFGEVLFDCFPDGSAVLGGAPFNVAWNLQGLGAEPLLISRVGMEREGRAVEVAMRDWGMDITGLQQDEAYPTGRVEVQIEADHPRFDIVADQAYDHIDADAALWSVGNPQPAMIYHGSLIRRADSANALQSLIDALKAPVFLDINLRPPWWQPESLLQMISNARWLKLNDEELRTLQPLLDLTAGAASEALAMELRQHFGLEVVMVTCGAKGAFAVDHEDQLHREPVTVTPRLVDTVGAGDAFSAMAMLGLAGGWPLPLLLQRAQHFAAGICGIRGATSHDRELYRWQ